MSETAKVTEFEKSIYNKHLAISRSSINKPFKLRKDWSDFEETSNYPLVVKLAYFFTKHSHVNLDDFFRAPYDIYSETETPFDLKFYISQRALKIYTLYMQKKRVQSPDTDEQLYSIKKTLQYILTYCTRNQITVDDYITHSTGSVPAFMKHLKKGDINIYALFGFSNFEKVLRSIDTDTVKFILGDIHNNLPRTRTQFQSSRIAKSFITAGIDKIRAAYNKQVAITK